jgi:hypothetical protein
MSVLCSLEVSQGRRVVPAGLGSFGFGWADLVLVGLIRFSLPSPGFGGVPGTQLGFGSEKSDLV